MGKSSRSSGGWSTTTTTSSGSRSPGVRDITADMFTVKEVIGGGTAIEQMEAEIEVVEVIEEMVRTTETEMSDGITMVVSEETIEVVEGASEVIDLMEHQEKEIK